MVRSCREVHNLPEVILLSLKSIQRMGVRCLKVGADGSAKPCSTCSATSFSSTRAGTHTLGALGSPNRMRCLHGHLDPSLCILKDTIQDCRRTWQRPCSSSGSECRKRSERETSLQVLVKRGSSETPASANTEQCPTWLSWESCPK